MTATSDDPVAPGSHAPAVRLVDGPVTFTLPGFTDDTPFAGSLVLRDAHGAQATIALDPLLVRDLFEALARVHLAQREALGLPLAPDLPAAYDTVEDPEGQDGSWDTSHDDPDAPDTSPGDPDAADLLDDRPWWRRHRILTGLLAIIALVVLGATFIGALSVNTLNFR